MLLVAIYDMSVWILQWLLLACNRVLDHGVQVEFCDVLWTCQTYACPTVFILTGLICWCRGRDAERIAGISSIDVSVVVVVKVSKS